MKKLLTTFLLAVALTGLMLPALSHAYADESFNVGILRAEGQQQDYLFKEGDANRDQPVVAVIFKAIDLLTKTIGSLAVGTLILSGLWLVTSHGEQTQIDKGKKIFEYAIIGVVFAFMSYIIATLVQGFFK
ncbi:MAG: hypothetical protein UT33_C0021G0012 [Candidatus Peregrinibacteria bacterium GW2011_GWC2_39_14]|nr:MAG: hypothetical protein US92_C0013G0012 [Candidatus Peregrinibacteria bacterium GW2011_GWA2_38_36]KKR04376.1 MAG: hypothetical protein UT33_C0021G0012 [Candidatus Peregrinibacteria bacterium GW2011_GWC2_39_14]